MVDPEIGLRPVPLSIRGLSGDVPKEALHDR